MKVKGGSDAHIFGPGLHLDDGLISYELSAGGIKLQGAEAKEHAEMMHGGGSKGLSPQAGSDPIESVIGGPGEGEGEVAGGFLDRFEGFLGEI